MDITYTRLPNVERERAQLRAVNRKLFAKWRIIGAVMWPFALGCLIYGIGSDSGIRWGWTIAGYLLVAVGTLFFDQPRKYMRAMLRQSGVLNYVVDVRVTDAEVTVTMRSTTVTFLWAGVASVEDTGRFWIAKDPAGVARFALQPECMIPEHAAEVRAFLSGQQLLTTAGRK